MIKYEKCWEGSNIKQDMQENARVKEIKNIKKIIIKEKVEEERRERTTKQKITRPGEEASKLYDNKSVHFFVIK